jgi:hypothetical protein
LAAEKDIIFLIRIRIIIIVFAHPVRVRLADTSGIINAVITLMVGFVDRTSSSFDRGSEIDLM